MEGLPAEPFEVGFIQNVMSSKVEYVYATSHGHAPSPPHTDWPKGLPARYWSHYPSWMGGEVRTRSIRPALRTYGSWEDRGCSGHLRRASRGHFPGFRPTSR
jgi:hypothetical protein